MTPEQWGEQFESMAHKAEDCPVALPPDFGKDPYELIKNHLLYGCVIKHPERLRTLKNHPPSWQLFFAE